MANPSSRTHIDEIVGLRGVAQLAVVFYHANVANVAGGFVGMGVFFVISGYLITRIPLPAPGNDAPPLAKFYAGRILRIAPALFSTRAPTAVLYFALLPPVTSADLLASFASAVLSYPNFWFHFTVDYFSNHSGNPVLHTWSLAVEDQFYIVFPLLLLWARKIGITTHHARTWFVLLFALSLASAYVTVFQHPSKAFYFPWLRA